MRFKVEKILRNSLARAGRIETAHGVIETPAFVPVATQAAFKGVPPEAAKAAGTQVIFTNTFHLHLSPGEAVVKSVGGLHKFMNWSGPIMTDSGGFQVFSLGAAYGQGVSKVATSKPGQNQGLSLGYPLKESPYDAGSASLVKIDDDGVNFRSPRDGSLHRLTPESSIIIQHDLGADVILAFDECASPRAPYDYQCQALERTHRWAERSLKEHRRLESEKGLSFPEGKSLKMPALFGIVQGGRFSDLRTTSAQFISTLGVDGFAIGGSFNKEDIGTIVELVNRQLPPDRPRHLLGIGEVEDIFAGIMGGVDTFDCVTPTRLGRHGTVETKQGRINLISGKFAADFKPIEDNCDCQTCQNYSRAYLRHLFRSREMLAVTLASIHNLRFFVSLLTQIRQAIFQNTFDLFREQFLARYLSH
ncbi:MAG: tRNA guanosine(34) transglycosylase Tgt [Candidatus Vogelbacteria bacterium]|nr:tRNA guanosine(34) transglycosylase Tgt [Candidatus Vogelbacteria bacterium]